VKTDRRTVSLMVAAVILCGLGVTRAPAAEPPSPEIVSAWRELFKRAPEPVAPVDNVATPEKIALGAQLFSDRRLSRHGERSCIDCHRPERAFTDGRRRARGLSGRPLPRNTPSLFNLAWGKQFFWDGRAASLEEQVQGPILAADEMGGDWPTILDRLKRDAGLAARFSRAYPGEPAISEATVVKALASYVRSLVSPPNRFDAWVGGNPDALSPSELRGFGLFVGKAGCVLCHVGWRFTDDHLHDIGLRSADPGQGGVAGGTPGLRAFKTPGLRELARTAPYMHDGSLPTLTSVLAHYTGRFVPRPSLAINMKRDLRLERGERADLIAFLRALSSTKNPASRTREAGRIMQRARVP